MFQSLLLVSSQITVGRKISEIERGYCAVDEPHYLEQFDGSARDALRFAEVEAHLFQQDAIGTEHLLLGAMHLKANYFPFLKYQDEDLEASLARVRATTEQVIGRGKSSLEAEMGFTSEAKQAIDEACAEGQHSNRGYVGVKQLFLVLLSVPECNAYRVLHTLLEDSILQFLRQLVAPQPFPSTPDEVHSYGRFTQQARQVVNLSQEEARSLQHHWAGTEHLLLGLLGEGEGKASQVLRNTGIELNQLRQEVESVLGRGDYVVPGEIALTPRVRRIITLAADEATRLGHDAVATSHLLLGLFHEGEGIAVGILEHLGVNLKEVGDETLRLLSDEEKGRAEGGH